MNEYCGISCIFIHSCKGVPVHDTNAYKRSTGTAPPIFAQNRVSGQLQALAALPLVSTEHGAGWGPKLVWTFLRREKSPVPASNWNPGPPATSLVLHYTKLSQIHIFIYATIKKYPAWGHLYSTLRHTMTGLSWAVLAMFLIVLNYRDLTAAIQPHTIITYEHQCLCCAVTLMISRTMELK
jgi:hypothetical protein